jgi:hypothetical protein
MHFVKLPNFLSFDPKWVISQKRYFYIFIQILLNRPFDPETYEDETTDALDEEGKTRVKLKVIKNYSKNK